MATSTRPRIRLGHMMAMSSPAPSPRSSSPATEPVTHFLSTSADVPSIIITPPAFELGVDDAPDYIALARRRRMRRTPPPSPHLLCVGWRRRPDSFPDPYGLVSDRSLRRSSSYAFPSSAITKAAAGALVSISDTISELDIAGFVSNAICAVLPADDKAALPLYRRRRSKARFALRPLVICVFLCLALALSLAIHGTLAAFGTPLANKSHTGAYPRHAYAHTQYGRYYDMRVASHRAKYVGVDADVYYRVQRTSVGVTLPKSAQQVNPARKAPEVKSVIDAFSAGVLNPWDFH